MGRTVFDIHCHILFNVDDGPNSIGESIMMLHMAYESGTRSIIATPHVQSVTQTVELVIYKRIQSHFEELKNYAAQSLPKLKLYLGAEIMVSKSNCQNANFIWHSHLNYGLNETDFLLVEFPHDITLKEIRMTIDDLLAHGKKPVLAHIENYKCLRGDLLTYQSSRGKLINVDYFGSGIGKIIDLKARGAYLQVSASTLSGGHDRESKKWVLSAIEENLVDFIGSDGHSAISRKPIMKGAYDIIVENFGGEKANLIFNENPQDMIEGHYEATGAFTEKKAISAKLATAGLLVAAIGLFSIVGLGSRPLTPEMAQSPPVNNEQLVESEGSEMASVDIAEEEVALGSAIASESTDLQTQDVGTILKTIETLMNTYDTLANKIEAECTSLMENAVTEQDKANIHIQYNQKIGTLEVETDKALIEQLTILEAYLKKNNLSTEPLENVKSRYTTLKEKHRLALSH